MKLFILILFITAFSQAQVKDDISVVQYTAGFASEMSLDVFNDYNTQTLYIEKHPKIFKKENIKFLPTVCLYSDGELIVKIESGISLKLPENCREILQENIDVLLEQRF
jgi:hypothetical protein|tara:strand:+ start:129 stop:455 length:327 start_codon:yes stop_codon:yes gene_type:complete